MDRPYSVVADVLNKFHTAPDWIQALWLLVMLLAVLGPAYLLLRAVRDVAVALIDRRGVVRGRTLYALYETPDGRWMLYARGKVRELSGEGIGEGRTTLPAPRRR